MGGGGQKTQLKTPKSLKTLTRIQPGLFQGGNKNEAGKNQVFG